MDQAAADRRVLDQKRGGTIASLNLDYLLFERPKREAAAHHLENVKALVPVQHYDTRRIIAGLCFTQGYVPAHDNAVAGLKVDVVVAREPFSLDNRATGRNRALLVLGRKRDGAHLALEFHQHVGWLMVGVEELSFLPRIGATATEVIGLCSCLLYTSDAADEL